jgi:hypothetical protein
MILTIQAADKNSFRSAIWEASQMMGLEVEPYADNTFKVIVHDRGKVDRILSKSGGSVIYQQDTENIFG